MTSQPPSGRTKYSLAELRTLAASVGFPDPDTAAAVAMAESGGNPYAVHVTTEPGPGTLPERSFGLWQVNVLTHPEFTASRLIDATYNAHAALLISKSGTDWNPWSTFTQGQYLKYMPGAANVSGPSAPAPVLPYPGGPAWTSDRAYITRYQTALAYLANALPYDAFNPGPIDGVCGASTVAAVQAFQRWERLAVDGRCGPDTARALDRAVDYYNAFESSPNV